MENICFKGFMIAAVLILSGCSEASDGQSFGRINNVNIWKMDIKELYPESDAMTLAKMAANGNASEIEKLITSGVSPNIEGVKGVTPLFWAYRNRNIEGALSLLKHGANPNLIFSDNVSLIHIVCRQGDIEFLKALLEYEANPNLLAERMRVTPLFKSIDIYGELGDFSIASLLIEYGADLNIQSAEGNTVTMLAARLGRLDLATFFVEQGADTTILNNQGARLKDIISQKREQIDRNHELYDWLLKLESITKIE